MTGGGGYSTVSQADSGKLAALKGDRIVTLHPLTGQVAYVAGAADQVIRFYRALGGYPGVPEGCYALTPNPGTEAQVGKYSSPSWSPSGTELAWADARGIYAHPMPDFTNDCGTPAGGGTGPARPSPRRRASRSAWPRSSLAPH